MIIAINYIYVYLDLDLVSFDRRQFAAGNDVIYLSIGREPYVAKPDYKWSEKFLHTH